MSPAAACRPFKGSFPRLCSRSGRKRDSVSLVIIRTATGKNDNYRGLSFPGIGSGNGRKGSYLPRAEIARNAYQNTSEGNVRLRSQKSSTEIPTFFGRPLLVSLSLSSTPLPTSTSYVFKFSPCGVSILLFLAVVTDTHNILSAGRKREGVATPIYSFHFPPSSSSAIRSHLIFIFSLFLSCRAAPLRDHGRRDRGRAGQGAEVPATDHGRVPRQDERDQDEEGRQPPAADARVLQVAAEVSTVRW